MLRLATIFVCVLVVAGGGCEKAAAPVKVHAANTMPASHPVEYMGDGDAGRTIINLAGKKKAVTYHAVAGDAVVEGDIILCSIDEAKRNKPALMKTFPSGR